MPRNQIFGVVPKMQTFNLKKNLLFLSFHVFEPKALMMFSSQAPLMYFLLLCKKKAEVA